MLFWLLGILGLSALSKPDGGRQLGEKSEEGGIGVPDGEALKNVRDTAKRLGFSDGWAAFLTAVAYTESRGNNLTGLGIPERFPPWAQPNTRASKRAQRNEARAAKMAYDRNKGAHYGACPWGEEAYTFGSGGWFGLLPANGLAAFWATDACVHPWSVFDPEASVVMAGSYAKRAMRRDNFKVDPTWANLRRGWASPASMGSPRPSTDRRFLEALDAIGVSRSFANARVYEDGNPVGAFDNSPAHGITHGEGQA